MEEFDYLATKLYRTSNSGILSTISKSNKDYPFGSFVTFVSLLDRSAYLYLSDIAEHTKNIKLQSKACLTILGQKKNNHDQQNNSRLSVMGNLLKIKEDELENCQKKFFSLLPESKNYANFHGFNFYKLEINKTRWIGGFGKIGWLDEKKWKCQKINWEKEEKKIIEHMNQDHTNTISAAINANYGIKDKNAKILFLTMDGYYAEANSKIYFIQTPQICKTSEDYRKNLISLAKEYIKFKIE
tara:strand:- start:2072 stop:2797 length:726 start_codon:yes stop_codon:yes gene_type:complete